MDEEGLIARNVRLRMEARGLGPKALSLKAGLNSTYVRDILQGRSRNPRQAHLQSLADALDCSVGDLTSKDARPDITLTEQSRVDLLAAFDGMNEEARRALLAVAKALGPGEKPGGAGTDPAPAPKRREVNRDTHPLRVRR